MNWKHKVNYYQNSISIAIRHNIICILRLEVIQGSGIKTSDKEYVCDKKLLKCFPQF